MSRPLNAQERVALRLGSAIMEAEALADQVNSLKDERDQLHARVAELENGAAKSADHP